MLKKAARLQFSPLPRSAHGSQRVNLDCKVTRKITFKVNFIDSCLWTIQTAFLTIMYSVMHSYFYTKRVALQMAATNTEMITIIITVHARWNAGSKFERNLNSKPKCDWSSDFLLMEYSVYAALGYPGFQAHRRLFPNPQRQ